MHFTKNGSAYHNNKSEDKWVKWNGSYIQYKHKNKNSLIPPLFHYSNPSMFTQVIA
jgi:hypothetical protein